MEAAALKSHPPESTISVEIAGNLPELTDEPLLEFPIKEELIEEVTQEPYTEITTTSDCAKSSSPAATFPTPSLVVEMGRARAAGHPFLTRRQQ
ncbi:hypothetical protein FF1_034612 [Malus domestica]